MAKVHKIEPVHPHPSDLPFLQNMLDIIRKMLEPGYHAIACNANMEPDHLIDEAQLRPDHTWSTLLV